jgi:uncharacterized protein
VFWPTVMAYLRVATHASVFARPLPREAAIGNVEALLALPNVQKTGEHDFRRFDGIDVRDPFA